MSDEWFEALMKMNEGQRNKRNRVPEAYIHYNSLCTECSACEKEMVRIGIIVLCYGCYEKLFPDVSDATACKKVYNELRLKHATQLTEGSFKL